MKQNSINWIFLFAFFLAIVVATNACKHEPFNPAEPNPVDPNGPNSSNPCDPDSVYFSQQILPILTSNCAMPGCHDAASHEDGIVLDNYANVLSTGKIKINNPADSKIYKVLNDSDPNDRMPPAPMSALPLDQRQLILQWIQQGAQNLSCSADCDTTNVKFSTHVQPLINLKCKGCHGANNPSGGISLTTYNQVKTSVANGQLWGSINHASGYKPMPYPIGNAKMPDCDLRKVKIWMDNGAPND